MTRRIEVCGTRGRSRPNFRRGGAPIGLTHQGYYRRLSLGAEHFLRARDLIASMASVLSTLDGLHLSVGLSAGIPLLTADRDFARAARRHDAAATLIKAQPIPDRATDERGDEAR